MQTYSSSELCSGRDIRFPMDSQLSRSASIIMLGYGTSPTDIHQILGHITNEKKYPTMLHTKPSNNRFIIPST